MKQRLQRRLLVAFVATALGVSLVFAGFALNLPYTIEQHFFDNLLSNEAARQHQAQAQLGRWLEPELAMVVLHTRNETLPAGLAERAQAGLLRTPGVLHLAGDEPGHAYRLLSLRGDAAAPWLVVDVSRRFVLRPMRRLLLGWLLAGCLTVLGLSLALGWWLARYLSAPLEQLAARVERATPEQLPQALASGLRDDEVGALARRFDALLARTHDFIAREQAFTRDASHELRTPLSVLRMALERLQTEPALADSLLRQLVPMCEACELMALTIDTLLLLAREGPNCEPTSTSAPAPAQTFILPLAERWVLAHASWLDQQALGLAIELKPDDGLPLPAPVLQVVLASLLGNAFMHGQAGGVVTVALSDGALVISNPGVPALLGAGEPGVKNPAPASAGLGLSILHRLLQRHRAELSLRHQGGQTQARVKVGQTAHPPGPS